MVPKFHFACRFPGFLWMGRPDPSSDSYWLEIINYGFAILCENSQSKARPALSRVFLISAIIINLAFLFFYKYLSAILLRFEFSSAIPPSLIDIVLPLGISYLTLTGISYVVDVYRGVEKAERNFLQIGSYLIMFPKVLQGPITRFGSVKNDFDSSGFATGEILQGIRRLIVGLVKKVLIADKLAIVASAAFSADPADIGMDVAWFGLIAFTLQIFFDFSGVYGYGDRVGDDFRFSSARKFQLSIYQPQHHRFLAQVAHVAHRLALGLRFLPWNTNAEEINSSGCKRISSSCLHSPAFGMEPPGLYSLGNLLWAYSGD